jgi:hypothetical protein
MSTSTTRANRVCTRRSTTPTSRRVGTDSLYQWLARWDGAWRSWRINDLEIGPVAEHRTGSVFSITATATWVQRRQPRALGKRASPRRHRAVAGP